MQSLLKLENVEKYYGNQNNVTKAVNRINLTVEKGEFLAVMGASGSGKTTLLNCISTIDTVSAGHIYLDGKDITAMPEDKLATFRRENLGFIFQDFNLLDTLTLGENIALTLTINKADPATIPERVRTIAATLGIEKELEKFPYQVSGGQKQRCACARAIVNGQKLILADEPTGALDSKSARQLLQVMENMNEEMKATIIMVTHDAFSASYSQRVLFLKDGQIFNQIEKGDDNRRTFYNRILDVLAVLGGELSDAW